MPEVAFGFEADELLAMLDESRLDSELLRREMSILRRQREMLLEACRRFQVWRGHGPVSWDELCAAMNAASAMRANMEGTDPCKE